MDLLVIFDSAGNLYLHTHVYSTIYYCLGHVVSRTAFHFEQQAPVECRPQTGQEYNFIIANPFAIIITNQVPGIIFILSFHQAYSNMGTFIITSSDSSPLSVVGTDRRNSSFRILSSTSNVSGKILLSSFNTG